MADLRKLRDDALAAVERAAGGQLRYNRILDDAARGVYAPIIEVLFALAPEMMSRKIAEANVQQGFVLDTSLRIAGDMRAPRILCVGSHVRLGLVHVATGIGIPQGHVWVPGVAVRIGSVFQTASHEGGSPATREGPTGQRVRIDKKMPVIEQVVYEKRWAKAVVAHGSFTSAG